ncbi:MAG: ATP-binding cassette domain-containing protein [Mycoplasmatales bacterium]
MLKVENVKYSFKKTKREIKQLVISENGLYKIIGENGSGKTSLLNGIVKAIRKKMKYGYVTQEISLFENLSIAENIKVFIGEDEAFMKKFDENLKKLNLVIEYNHKICNLSFGQKRKVQLAICLSTEYKVLILDEPFNHLDQKSKTNLKELLAQLSKKRIILIVEHHEKINEDYIIEISEELIFVKNEQKVENENSRIMLPKSKKKRNIYLIYKNLKVVSKIYLFLMLCLCVLGFAYFQADNPLTTRENGFIYPFISNDKKSENSIEYKCLNPTVEDPWPELYLNNNYSVIDNAEFIDTSLIENLYFIRNKAPAMRYGSVAAKFQQPKTILEKYDGPLPYYQFDRLYIGTFPDDNSNEILIDYFHAKQLQKQLNISEMKELIGQEFTVEKLQVKSKISGIYLPNEDNYSYILFAYTGVPQGSKMCYLSQGDNVAHKSVLLINLLKIIQTLFFCLVISIILFFPIMTLEKEFFRTLRRISLENEIIKYYIYYCITIFILQLIYYFDSVG